MCFSICRFSQVVFIPQAQPHAQSLFLFPIVFGINVSFVSNHEPAALGAVQSFSSGQARSWSPTPCQLVSSQSVRAGEPIHSHHCLRARAPIIDQLPVVVAHLALCSCAGSLELACQVCWFSAFHAACAPYILICMARSNSVRSNHLGVKRIDRIFE